MSRKEKVYKYHFIYKTTNIKNSKFYIGMHSTDNLDDGYLGSGKRLRNSIRKHGKDVHVREILEYCFNRKDLSIREKEIVNELLIENSLCMNLVIGGSGSNNGGGDNFKHANIYWSIPINKERLRNIAKEHFKKIWANPEHRKYMKFFRKSFKGKSHSEETKKTIGSKNSISQKGNKNSQFGKIWITNEKEDKKISSADLEKYILFGWRKGRNKNCNKKN